jgi:hypothetical protein
MFVPRLLGIDYPLRLRFGLRTLRISLILAFRPGLRLILLGAEPGG